MWRTGDGGRTWEEVADLTANQNELEFLDSQQLYFIDHRRGWVIDPFYVFYTDDGGVTWHKGSYVSRIEVTGQPLKVVFLTPAVGWACITTGEIYYTEDGGKRWLRKGIVGDGVQPTDIFFLDKDHGWVSANNVLFITGDGGKSWRRMQVADRDVEIKSVYFMDGDRGWVTGWSAPAGAPREAVKGIILHTSNGRDWKQIQIGENERFFDRIYFADKQHGWLLSRDNVYRTEDGGMSWRIVMRLAPLSGI